MKMFFPTSLVQRVTRHSLKLVINRRLNTEIFHFVLSTVPKKSEYLVLSNMWGEKNVNKIAWCWTTTDIYYSLPAKEF
jgi:hypothetical protein